MASTHHQAQNATISAGKLRTRNLWRLTKQPKRLKETVPPHESAIINALIAEPEILSAELLIFGQQENAGSGQIADLIAIDRDGTVYQIEVALGRPVADALVGALACRAWLTSLTVTDAQGIYNRFSEGDDFEAEFMRYFNIPITEVQFNGRREAVLLTTEVEPRSVRGITALRASGIDVTVLLLRFFDDMDEVILSCECVVP